MRQRSAHPFILVPEGNPDADPVPETYGFANSWVALCNTYTKWMRTLHWCDHRHSCSNGAAPVSDVSDAGTGGDASGTRTGAVISVAKPSHKLYFSLFGRECTTSLRWALTSPYADDDSDVERDEAEGNMPPNYLRLAFEWASNRLLWEKCDQRGPLEDRRLKKAHKSLPHVATAAEHGVQSCAFCGKKLGTNAAASVHAGQRRPRDNTLTWTACKEAAKAWAARKEVTEGDKIYDWALLIALVFFGGLPGADGWASLSLAPAAERQ